jgi:hypothetical protein
MGMISPPQGLDLDLHPVGVQAPHLVVDHVAGAVKKQKGRHTPHAKTPGKLPANGAIGTQAQDVPLSLQVRFESVYDRLCQEAGASSVGVEFHNRWLAAVQDRIHLFQRRHVAGRRAQRQEGNGQRAEDEQKEPVFAQEALRKEPYFVHGCLPNSNAFMSLLQIRRPAVLTKLGCHAIILAAYPLGV